MRDRVESKWSQGLAALPASTLRTVEMHTAGEPVRIVVAGYPELEGKTILEKRADAEQRFDHIRRALMLEPRGHAGMYGVIPLPASAPDAAFGVLFMHNDGYSTMCGHATIAIGRWAVETGIVASHEGRAAFRLETPCGVIPVAVETCASGGGTTSFTSVPCFASHIDCKIATPSFGELSVDIAFGGAFYAIVRSSRLGLPFAETSLSRLIEAGTEITAAIRNQVDIAHPNEPDLGFLYGTILIDDADPAHSGPTANVCIFADGQLDRSPTGSGVCARLALDYARGRVKIGVDRTFYGVSGERFIGAIVKAEGSGRQAKAIISVSGQAYYTGISEFIIEPNEPLTVGFKLPDRMQVNKKPPGTSRAVAK